MKSESKSCSVSRLSNAWSGKWKVETQSRGQPSAVSRICPGKEEAGWQPHVSEPLPYQWTDSVLLAVLPMAKFPAELLPEQKFCYTSLYSLGTEQTSRSTHCYFLKNMEYIESLKQSYSNPSSVHQALLCVKTFTTLFLIHFILLNTESWIFKKIMVLRQRNMSNIEFSFCWIPTT